MVLAGEKMKNYEAIYEKNLNALRIANFQLWKQLSDFQENSRFEPTPQNEYFDILDTLTNQFFYNDVSSVMEKNLRFFNQYTEQPFLYFFGIGNGYIIKQLLDQTKQTITVTEPSLELLFIALHLEDFSTFLQDRRLQLFLADELEFAPLVSYLNQDVRIYYARLYNLHLGAPIYQALFEEAYIKTNKLFVDAMEFIITNSGNDIKDALMGLEHHIYNIPRMVAGTQFQEFIKHKNADTVIMVSTGPSLTKQLPLLKEIQNHATIICADSALRILYAHDITPDICVSLERIPYVAELFIDLPSSYKQKVVFVRASLEHKSVFPTLEGCKDILVLRPYKYNTLFGLEPYGILCSGTSVANMAHELSAFMDYKTCIIIGQDLAYASDGNTHSKGHILGEKDSSISEKEEKIQIPAYGGEGIVYTNRTWQLFRNGLIQTVDATKNRMLTINATEGGARIDGTKELSFKEAIELYVTKSTCKTPLKLPKTSKKEAKKYYTLVCEQIDTILKEGEVLQKKFEEAFLTLAKTCKKLEKLPEKKQLKVFSEKKIIKLLNLISNTRGIMEENLYFKKFYWELMQSLVVHYELELARIKCIKPNSQEDNTLKALNWIFNHSHYFYTIAGGIDNVIFTIKKAREESLEELPKSLGFLLKR
ncbi:MAG TPA: hypothetical protein CFH82_01890 [Sulfurospirillum sp. UBA12182]|nr:MAG TPA: hypothetical protein CFH82_01890 [Sulfurospirillum sp. UBA12182]